MQRNKKFVVGDNWTAQPTMDVEFGMRGKTDTDARYDKAMAFYLAGVSAWNNRNKAKARFDFALAVHKSRATASFAGDFFDGVARTAIDRDEEYKAYKRAVKYYEKTAPECRNRSLLFSLANDYHALANLSVKPAQQGFYLSQENLCRHAAAAIPLPPPPPVAVPPPDNNAEPVDPTPAPDHGPAPVPAPGQENRP